MVVIDGSRLGLMIEDKFNQIVEESQKRCLLLRSKKRRDYANEDVLSNFKRVSEACSLYKIDITKPYGVALFLVVLKIDRLTKLINEGGTPQNESLNDTLDDLHNYEHLLEALLLEVD